MLILCKVGLIVQVAAAVVAAAATITILFQSTHTCLLMKIIDFLFLSYTSRLCSFSHAR